MRFSYPAPSPHHDMQSACLGDYIGDANIGALCHVHSCISDVSVLGKMNAIGNTKKVTQAFRNIKLKRCSIDLETLSREVKSQVFIGLTRLKMSVVKKKWM